MIGDENRRSPAHVHEHHAYTFGAMGTSCSLRFYDQSPEVADMKAALAIAEVERIEEKYSRYKSSNVMSAINLSASLGSTFRVDVETAGLLDYAFACYERSGGLFDITSGVLRRAWNFSSDRLPDDSAVKALLPLIGMDKLLWRSPELSFPISGMELDFGGLGKEYAVDRVAALLTEEGVQHGLVDLGGDLFAIGPHPNGNPWQIGLRDPHHAGKIAEEVALSHGALATSGDYERCIEIDGKRYSHILNPRTGWPVHGLASVTALAPRCMVAGSITTIALLKGLDGINWLATLGIPHRWVNGAGRHGGTMPPSKIR